MMNSGLVECFWCHKKFNDTFWRVAIKEEENNICENCRENWEKYVNPIIEDKIWYKYRARAWKKAAKRLFYV